MNVNRRGFIELFGASALSAVSGGTFEQVDADVQDFDFDAFGLLVGPYGARPRPDGQYLARWDTYHFIYLATGDRAGQFFIDHDMNGWEQFDTDLVTYPDASPPSGVAAGHLSFNEERNAPQWYDGDAFEWPTFVENDHVETSATTVTNTTDETEVFRADIDAGALDVMGRVFIMRIFGKYSTAASTDAFTYRVYVGEPDFDPTAGEGTLITDVTTVQENVTDGPWQVKTTMTVFATGASGTLASHSEGAFNDTKNDDHVDPITVDTTTGEEFVVTVQWNNAKADNSVTRGIGYLQQQA